MVATTGEKNNNNFFVVYIQFAFLSMLFMKVMLESISPGVQRHFLIEI